MTRINHAPPLNNRGLNYAPLKGEEEIKALDVKQKEAAGSTGMFPVESFLTSQFILDHLSLSVRCKIC